MDILFDDKTYLFERSGHLAVIPTEYLEQLALRQRAAARRQSAYQLKEYLEWCECNGVAWNRASERDVMSFSQSLPEDKGSHNRKIDRVCDFYRFCEEHGVRNPTSRFLIRDAASYRAKRNLLHRKASRVSIREVPEVEEIQKFLECLKNSRNRLIADVMYESGMRVSEVLHLTRATVLATGVAKKETVACKVVGKGNKERSVILGKDVWNRLVEYANAGVGQWVFSADGIRPLSVDTVEVAFVRASKDAGIEKRIHPHLLRHAYASQWLHAVTLLTQKPVGEDSNLIILQALLGHQCLDTTSIYLHTVNRAQAAKIRTDVQLGLKKYREDKK